ncbi:hypothetical protein HKX48_005344 [Thoreauomyces humboldtii]|nr:hypothetical protein HKX48_005344 [Thoreauomyces humboldtii]
MLPWRQALHTQLVETLVNNKVFQRFAATTDQKLNELSGQGVRKANEVREDMLSDPEAMERTKAQISTFFEEFRKEIGEGVSKSFGGKK